MDLCSTLIIFDRTAVVCLSCVAKLLTLHKRLSRILPNLPCLKAPLLYHFMSLLMALAFGGRHKHMESKTCWFQFLAHFPADMYEIMCDCEVGQVERIETTF